MCQVDPLLGARCVTVDPYSPPPAEIQVGASVVVLESAEDDNYGRLATVIEEVPHDLEPLWEVAFRGSPTMWLYDHSSLRLIDRWLAVVEFDDFWHQSFYEHLHCDWPLRVYR